MEKIIKLILILLSLCINTKGQVRLDKEKVTGTWRASYTTSFGQWGGTTTTFTFTQYPDNRFYTVGNDGLPNNGIWKIEDDIMIEKWDNGSQGSTKTTYFDGRTWNYNGLGSNISYTAVKISDIPTVIPRFDNFGNSKNIELPRSSMIDLNQVYGTWKSQTNKGEVFYFNVYQDQRIYNSYGVNASWTIIDDKFYNYIDYIDNPSITKTISFSSSKWVYESLNDGTKYTATKVSTIPQKLNIQNVQHQDNTNSSESPSKSRYSSSGSICYSCNGSCKMNCTSCYGAGGRKVRINRNRYDYNCKCDRDDSYEVWEQCTAMGCDNGKTKCTQCNCKSVGINVHSMNKVPYDEDIFGKWKASSGDIYTFYSNLSYDHDYIVDCLSGNNKFIGKWKIEDGLFKIYFTYYGSEWKKYSFNSFSKTELSLYNIKDFQQLKLKKIK